MRRFWASVWEVAEVVIIAFITVFIIRTYLVQPFLVSGASMEPNFSSGNYLIIDEITYRFREPARGEVIVFRYPQDPTTFFIKRIIGLPEERVVVLNHKVFIYPKGGERFELNEAYLRPDLKTAGNTDIRLGADEYFVMGDNRYYSFDSRNWGPVTREAIIGLARLRVFPLNQFQAFNYQFNR